MGVTSADVLFATWQASLLAEGLALILAQCIWHLDVLAVCRTLRVTEAQLRSKDPT